VTPLYSVARVIKKKGETRHREVSVLKDRKCCAFASVFENLCGVTELDLLPKKVEVGSEPQNTRKKEKEDNEGEAHPQDLGEVH